LYVWNFYSSAWESVASHTSSSLTALSGNLTPDATHTYISSDYFYAQISSKAIGSPDVDYVKLDVTYTASETTRGHVIIINE
jgi:hypothetical protein